MHPSAFILSCTVALSACTTQTHDTTFDTLLLGIEHRLDLAEAVALHKWDTQQPVQATEREQQVIANAQHAARARQQDPARAAAFFADQIEANKLLQYQLLDDWHLNGKAPSLPRRDLNSDLRPTLDQLQGELLDALANFDASPVAHCQTRLAHALQQRTHDPQRHLALIRATGQLCKSP